MKRILFIAAILTTAKISTAQTGISAAGTAPDASAMLDVIATDKGFLAPRVNLVAVNNSATPITSPADGLLVYNLGGGGVPTKGFYYWDATNSLWQKVIAGNGTFTTGSGTQNYVTKWNNAAGTTIGNSQIFDDGTNVGINSATPGGKLDVNGGALRLSNAYLDINRIGFVKNGISWYSQTYPSWSTYMSPAATTSTGPHGDLTAPSGTFVTSWALRDYIENNAGYGWTFESAANTTTPTVKFEIRASDGLFHAYGNGIIDGSAGIGTTAPAGKLHVVTTSGDGNVGAWDNSNLVVGQSAASGVSSGAVGISYSTTNNAGYISALSPTTAWRDLGFRALNTIFYYNGATEGMRLTNSGNLGIGTTGPESILHIEKNASGAMGGDLVLTNKVSATNTAVAIDFGVDNSTTANGAGNAQIKVINMDGANQKSDMTFSTWNGSAFGERMRITSNGNVGIGIAGPSEKFEVTGAIKMPGASATDNNSPALTLVSDDDFLYDGEYINHYAFGFHNYNDGAGLGGNSYISGYYGIDLFTGGTQRFRINNNGSVKVTNLAGTGTRMVTADASGLLGSTAIPGGVLPAGSTGQTLYHNGTSWTATSNLYNNGTTINLGQFTTADVDEWAYVTWLRTGTYDEGLIKGSSARGVWSRPGFGIHMDASKHFGFFSSGWDPLVDIEGATGRMYIKGNTGIGATAPLSKLHVRGGTPTGIGTLPANTVQIIENGASNNYLTFRNTGDNATYAGLQFQDNNVGGYIVFKNCCSGNSDAMMYGTYQDHVFQNGTSEAVDGKVETMRIKQNGNVGIGINNPTGKLHVGGSHANGVMADGNDRPSIAATGNYPQMVLMAGVANANHGSTVMLGSYDSGNSGNHKHWSIGTAGNGATFLDIGYHAGTDLNPHAGIRNYNGSTFMTILNNGNVGIGSLTPGYKLDVIGNTRISNNFSVSTDNTTGNGIYLADDGSIVDNNDGFATHRFSNGLDITSGNNQNTQRILLKSDGNIQLVNNGSPTINFNDSDEPDYYFHNNSDRLYVLHGDGYNAWNGNRPLTIYQGNKVGFNEITPSAALHVTGYAQTAAIIGSGGSYYTDWPGGWGGGLSSWDLCIASIRYSGTQTRSDIRLKKDIESLSTNMNAVETLNKLRPVTYHWIDERLPKNLRYGFIAQEIQKVLPELVDEGTDTMKTLAVNYEDIIPILTQAIQEQQKQIEALKSTNTISAENVELKNEIAELKKMMLEMEKKVNSK